jgi:HTH-type transcriptional regulator/antitoxin MqsA
MKNHELAVCPVCSEGRLNQTSEPEQCEYRGHLADLLMQFAVCDVCGITQAGSEQLRANKRSVTAFHKDVDGLLTGSQVRELRAVLSISQAEAAKIFGGGPVAFSKYENDEVSQSEPMDKLLRVAMAVPQAFSWLAEYAGLRVSVTHLSPGEVELLKPTYARSWALASSFAKSSVHVVSKGEYRTNSNRTRRASELDQSDGE